MKVRLIIFVVFVLISNLVHSQVTQEWVRNYSGPLNLGASPIKVLNDNDNGVYVYGECVINIGINLKDLVLIKYNSSGVEQWTKIYNNPLDQIDKAGDITIDNSGNIFITGYTSYSNNHFFSTVKYASTGNQNWAVQYNSNPPSQLYNNPVAICADNSGNIYVTALSSYKEQESDYLTVKYNSNGILQWEARFNDGADYPYDMKVDTDGNIYVTGYSTSDSMGYDIKTIKYNNSGALQWVRKYQSFVGTPISSESRLTIGNDGSVYVAGACYGPFDSWDFVLIKYLPDGSQSWVKHHGAGGYDKFIAMAIDFQNNIYVTGIKHINNENQCIILRYNSFGDLTKEIIFDGPGNGDYPADIKVDSDRNIYVTGSVWDGNLEFFTLKYDSSGAQRWVKYFTGKGNPSENVASMSLDYNNNVFVTGLTLDKDFMGVMTTIKYSQSTGIQTLSNELPAKFSLSQNYPNPFNPSTNIKFEIAKATNVKLVVYDALGKEVKILANETMQPGSYNANFTADELNSGIYFYSLITDSYKETKKMILLK